MGSTVVGLFLIALAIGSAALIVVLLRIMPRLRAASPVPAPTPSSPHIAPHNEAVLVVQSGGRVTYMNQQAREMFNVWEDDPNLESLARRTRPSEAFLLLCASEGQSRFTLGGRFIEGISYFTPDSIASRPESGNAMLVSLRRPQIVLDGDSPLTSGSLSSPDAGAGPVEGEPQRTSARADVSSQAFNIFTELSQAMTASLDLEQTLSAILENSERLLPSEFLEITIWDSTADYLQPYRLVGMVGVDRHLEKAPERYHTSEGYSGHLVKHRTPLLIKDVTAFRQVRPNLDRQRYPFRSYLGVPLLIAGDFIGTLELASLNLNNYSESDQQVLELLAGQAAVALKNALLYRQETERTTELSGLANLSQTVSAIRDPQELYSQLIDNLAPLLNADILGFLIYDETRSAIEGQMPFKGIHPDLMQYCQIQLQPDTPAEAVWQSGDMVITTNAADDERIKALQLDGIAIATGMRHSVLVPLTSGGRLLGYLLTANKKDGSAFDRHDMRFLSIVAGQAAPIIENATLVQQSRRRAQRAETLRRIASLTSSSATLEEILKFSLLDFARLFQADIAVVLLLDEARGELHAHRSSVYGIPPELLNQIGRLPVDSAQFPHTITGSKQMFVTGDLHEAGLIPAFYQPLSDEMKIRSVLDVPLLIHERGIGELLVGSLRPNYFSNSDMQTVATASGQLAAAIERASLYSQTDPTLRRQVDQMTALTRIGRELNSTLKLDDLLQRVYDEVLHTTQAHCGSIRLFDLEKAYAIQSGWVKSDVQLPILLQVGDAVGSELHPLETRVLHDGEPIIIHDFATAPATAQSGEPKAGEVVGHTRFTYDGDPSTISEQDVYPAHAGVRSALICPIAYLGEVAGLIHLHSREPDHFTEAEREITEALAIQAAIALGNATRFNEQTRRTEELNRRVEALSKIFEVSQVLQSEQPLEEELEAIAYAIQSATPFDTVLMSVYNSHQNCLQRVAAAGVPLAAFAELQAHPAPWDTINSMLDPKFRLGRSYFLPAEQRSDTPKDLVTYSPSAGESIGSATDNSWQPRDVLIVPLFSNSGEPLGMISVDTPRDNQRPNQQTIETLEIFSTQAALVIESQLKVSELKTNLDRTESELALAKQAAATAQSHLPVLLHKDLEQTLSVQKLTQRARRINAGLDITETVSKQPNRTELLQALSEQTLRRMDVDVVLLAEPIAGGLSLTASMGSIPAEVNPKALLGQRNPLRHTLQTGEILLISDLSEDQEWQNTPLLRALEARSFFCLPILDSVAGSGNGKNGSLPGAALLAVSRAYSTPFDEQDHQLFDLVTRQVAIALQNLRLLDDTSHRLKEVNLLLDFSRQLGSLDPNTIIQTLLESAVQAVPSAQLAMVALWDARQGMLTPKASIGYTRPDELQNVNYRPGEGVPGQVFQTARSANIEEVEFTRHYNLSQQNLMRYRNAAGGQLPVSTLAVPIMAGGGNVSTQDSQVNLARISPLGVLVLDNAKATGSFTENDLAVVTSLSQQTALTLENARLYQGSRQRSTQLQALNRAAASVTSSLRTEELTTALLNQLKTILSFDTGTLWLHKHGDGYQPSEEMRQMVIRAAHGFDNDAERIGLTVDIEDSVLLNEMTKTRRPLWVPDVRKDARFQALSMLSDADSGDGTGFEYLSWLGLPLIASGRMIGVIALEKAEAQFYSSDDIQVAATYAGQAAVSLENAQLYEESIRRTVELDQRSQTLGILNRLSVELSGSLEVPRILDFAVQELMQLMNCTSTAAVIIESPISAGQYKTGPLGKNSPIILQAEYPYNDQSTPYYPGSPLPNAPVFDRLRETQGVFNTDDALAEADLAPLADYLSSHGTRSLLIVPMTGAMAPGGETGEPQMLGLLLAHGAEGQHFGAAEVALARTISSQVSIALQNAYLLAETLSLTEDLEQRVTERTAELGRERQRAETLLRIISELSASLDLDQVLTRTLHVLSEFVDAAQITILIARPGEKKLSRLASIGYTPGPSYEGSATPFDIDEGLAGWVISHRQAVMIADVQNDERWVKIAYPDENWKPTYQHRSALGVPLMSGAEALGCLLLFHPDTDHFSMDQLDLVQAAANQVAVAVNNAELYRLIRDQAEDLGTMLRSQQVETSRSKAILEAVADGVLVTDANRVITLFNQSAENVLGLARNQVLGKSLEDFSGLFGRATRSWMDTISLWSKDPASYTPGDTYSEQITLEDGRVIAVRLAPVHLRKDFLGTVSIFQDVTHQVEVDRLKSEFVATVSHELRTPMTSIKGYVEILLMGAAGQLSEQQHHFLQVVKSNTERLAVLVNDLLDISQIEAGRVRLGMQPVNLEEMTDQAIDELRRRTSGETKVVTVTKMVAPNLPRVFADPERIRRVMDNLLDNAFLYNLPNGSITVILSQTDNEVQVDIKDTGVGISPQDQAQVFDRFFRGENPLNLGVGGTGLGLSIVKNLVEMHKGRIWVQSSGISGEGTTFSFTLPIYVPEMD